MRTTVPASLLSTVGSPKIERRASSCSSRVSALHGRPIDVASDRDLDRLGRLLRELLAQEEVTLLRLEAVGQRRRPRRAGVERKHGRGEREQQAGGEHEAQHGAAHDAPDDRAPEAALPACLLGGASEERDAKRVHPVTEQREHGGEQGQRPDHGDDPDQDRAGGEAAEDRARNQQQSQHREHERDAAEEHGTTGRRAGGGDRIQLLAPLQALLPVPGEREQRVVDPEREAHADEHVLGEDGEVVSLRQDRHERERDDDRGDREHQRNEPGDDGAEDEQQHDEGERSAEEELALLQILQRSGVLVDVRRPFARHRSLISGLVVEALDDIDHSLDIVLPVPAERQQEDGRVPVLRDEAPVIPGGDDAFRTRPTKLIRERSDSRERRSRSCPSVVDTHDDDLRDRLPGHGLQWKALVDEPVGLLRLGRPRDLGLALEGEEHRHEDERARMAISQRPTTSQGRRLLLRASVSVICPSRELMSPRVGGGRSDCPPGHGSIDHQPQLCSTGGCGNSTPRARSSSYVCGRSSQ